MARYSRIRGPAVDFELTGLLSEVTGFSLRRWFDEGELLVLYSARILNGTVAAAEADIIVVLDGAAVVGSNRRGQAAAGARQSLTGAVLLSLSAGLHTVSLEAVGVAAVGDVIEADTAWLIVIQLPVWDSESELVDL